jgi:hypothetical protein
MGGAQRLVVRLVAAATAVALLTGFGEPASTFSLVGEVGDLLPAKGRPYRRYRTVRNDNGTLDVNVPKEWDEGRGEARILQPSTGERYGAGVSVSPSPKRFRSSFGVVGLRLTATMEPTTSSVNDTLTANKADFDEACPGPAPGVTAYDDGRYRGNYELFTECAGTKTAAVAVVARSTDGVFMLVKAQVRTRADLAAVDRAIRSAKLT